MNKKHLILGTAILAISLFIPSCRDYSTEDRLIRIGVGYFSVNQYIFDTWTTYHDQPFAILKTQKTGNNKIDSTYTNTAKFDWSEVFKVFFEADISDRDLLGHYKYAQYEDKEDNTVNFFYQANEDYQFTQKLLISADPFTNHIKAIYIETFNHNLLLGDTNQKLYYSALKKIQIQRNEAPLFGEKKRTVIEYYLYR